MTTTIYLCTPPVAPFFCRFISATAALVLAHITTAHAGFRTHPASARMLSPSPLRRPCTRAPHPGHSDLGMHALQHLFHVQYRGSRPSSGTVAARGTRRCCSDRVFVWGRRARGVRPRCVCSQVDCRVGGHPAHGCPARCPTALPPPAAPEPAVFERHLAVNAGAAHRIVSIPAGTATCEELARLMGLRRVIWIGVLGWWSGLSRSMERPRARCSGLTQMWRGSWR